MKLFLVGEGPGDIGYRNFWCPQLKAHVDLEGWLQPLIRRIRSQDTIEFCATARDRFIVDPTIAKRLRPLPPGHGAKALFAKRAALVGGFDIVIYMVDADTKELPRWREIVSQINHGFSLLSGNISCVACVPMSTSESWLLCDGKAWDRIANYKGILPDKPESLWGTRNDPEANHPHQYFQRVCSHAGINDDRDTRFRLANEIDLVTIKSSCPNSYALFEADLLAA